MAAEDCYHHVHGTMSTPNGNRPKEIQQSGIAQLDCFTAPCTALIVADLTAVTRLDLCSSLLHNNVENEPPKKADTEADVDQVLSVD